VKEMRVFLEYKGFVFEQPLRLDLLIDDVLMVELKAAEKVLPIRKAQLLSYMKLLNKPVGPLINFHELVLPSHKIVWPKLRLWSGRETATNLQKPRNHVTTDNTDDWIRKESYAAPCPC
jgi:hypothetical protein